MEVTTEKKGFFGNLFNKSKPSFETSVSDLIKLNVEALVDTGAVTVTTKVQDNLITAYIDVDKAEIGKVVGQQGKTIFALKTILRCVAAKADMRSDVVIVE